MFRSMREKSRELWQDKLSLFLHDNALSMRQFQAKKKIASREQLAYYRDFVSSDFFLYLKVKAINKETRFEDV